MPYLPIRPYISEGQKLAAPTNANLGPRHISETIRTRKLKSYALLDGPSTLLEYENFPARARAGGTAPHSVNWGPSHISETVRHKESKFYTHLDGTKCSFRA